MDVILVVIIRPLARRARNKYERLYEEESIVREDPRDCPSTPSVASGIGFRLKTPFLEVDPAS